MEETNMILDGILVLAGLLIFGAGRHYQKRENGDGGSRRIYATVSMAGIIVALLFAVKLAFDLM